ncbi:DUF3095 domain-containing protein [Ruegeria sp. 2205SS24-7]|uniref:DUF3095 domain-containing protein n=1 Tax=Ruegeria discodermiae TaxID=3064389 RepID=UPI0027408912|nr:DUF3095 domain-containing protein [Ruegeria sp. 2205SS24-7]MDP5219365.1 DUF3095 domain-containing protein [Ruegeria sp. 2205SS24-7]
MDQHISSSDYFADLPLISRFGDLTDPANYTPLPDGWQIGTADIVGSTRHIAEGRYKMVNMVGAAVISSQINAGGGHAFPYVFGGDGASFAIPPEFSDTSRAVLGVMRRWAEEEFGLELRAAQFPIGEIREAGLDVAVSRYQASTGVDYAMFGGGGLSWAEARMKEGVNAIPLADPGAQPDLTGLSCRWNNAPARNGTILSVVIQPCPETAPGDFAAVTRQIVAVVETLSRGGHPLPLGGPGVRWPPPGLALEAHVSRGDRSLLRRKAELLVGNLIAWFFFKTGVKAGEFDPAHYANMVTNNADFRKFDDGLKMTLDCDAATVERLRQILEAAEGEGILRFGLFEQDEAMTTCFVPSVVRDDHIHLVDGASGGYARAAEQIKSAIN